MAGLEGQRAAPARLQGHARPPLAINISRVRVTPGATPGDAGPQDPAGSSAGSVVGGVHAPLSDAVVSLKSALSSASGGLLTGSGLWHAGRTSGASWSPYIINLVQRPHPAPSPAR